MDMLQRLLHCTCKACMRARPSHIFTPPGPDYSDDMTRTCTTADSEAVSRQQGSMRESGYARDAWAFNPQTGQLTMTGVQIQAALGSGLQAHKCGL